MKRVSFLSAAAVAAGAALIAPDAQACEDCMGGGTDVQCDSMASSGFGSCQIKEEYDECGEVIYTDCYVSYDAWCDQGSGSDWGGFMYWQDWVCFAYTYDDCGRSWAAE